MSYTSSAVLVLDNLVLVSDILSVYLNAYVLYTDVTAKCVFTTGGNVLQTKSYRMFLSKLVFPFRLCNMMWSKSHAQPVQVNLR